MIMRYYYIIVLAPGVNIKGIVKTYIFSALTREMISRRHLNRSQVNS